jgi:dTDP-4-dehydrorhamnose reductase
MKKESFLIIGGDGWIGSSLKWILQRSGYHVMATTRWTEKVDPLSPFLDLERPDEFKVPARTTYAFFLAAMTGVACENNPTATVVNTETTPALIHHLFDQGVFINFISSSQVFDGLVPYPDEETELSPTTEYARHKVIGEKAVLERGGTVTRLTRCLGPLMSPLPSWFDCWKAGLGARPFKDLFFSPISIRYVTDALLTIADGRVSGPLHLSGAGCLSFADLARQLAKSLTISEKLIEPVVSDEVGVKLGHSPAHPELGMTRTMKLTGIGPQPVAQAVAELASDCVVAYA